MTLGLGVLVGAVIAIGHFLVVLFPYAVLASGLDKDKKDDGTSSNRFKKD